MRYKYFTTTNYDIQSDNCYKCFHKYHKNKNERIIYVNVCISPDSVTNDYLRICENPKLKTTKTSREIKKKLENSVNIINKINIKLITLERFIKNALSRTQKASIKPQQRTRNNLEEPRKAKSEYYVLDKMINDVSKMINTNNNTNISTSENNIKHTIYMPTTTTQPTPPPVTKTMTTIVIPSIYNESTKKQFAENTARTKTTTKTIPMPCFSEKLAEFIEPTTLIKTTSASTLNPTSVTTSITTQTSPTARAAHIHETLTCMPPALNKIKSKENKCTLRESFNVSNKTEFTAYTSALEIRDEQFEQTQLQPQQKEEINIQGTTVDIVQEVPEKCSYVQELSKKHNATTLTLAERKAKLKADFFKDSSSATPTEIHRQILMPANSNANPLKQCIQWPNNNNLKFPRKEILFSVSGVTSSTSLVSQRKWELANKLKEQKQQSYKQNEKFELAESKKSAEAKEIVTAKTGIQKLVQKFDTNQNNFIKKIITSSIKRKMQVNVNKSEEKTSTKSIRLLLKSASMDQRNSPLSDEGCNLGLSPYSSDNEENDSVRTGTTIIERIIKRKEMVARSASSDSALGLDVDDVSMDIAHSQSSQPLQTQRRMTLTVTDLPLRPALLPLAEPTALPDSPTADIHHTFAERIMQQQTAIPSKVLLEERVVEIPEDPRSQSSSESGSRRESTQSFLSDCPNSESAGVRVVRTPSVVVSDYSDDVVCGITLEEIEYFRAQRMRRRRSSLDTAGTEKDTDVHSDVSASSSCSNLYYCGSTISALDGGECYVNGMRLPLERKASDCSQYSMISGDEDNYTIPEHPEETLTTTGAAATVTAADTTNDIAFMLAAQHLSNARTKKVGATKLGVHELQPHTFG